MLNIARFSGQIGTTISGSRVMLAIVESVLAVLKVLLTARGLLPSLFLGSLVNATVIFTIAMGGLALREGSFRAAYQAVLEPSGAAADRERLTRIALSQAQLRQEAATLASITRQMEGFIARWPSVSRVRTAVIHNGVIGLGNKHEWKYDVIAASAAPGRVPGPLITNEPIARWIYFLNDLLAGKCNKYRLSDIQAPVRTRMEALGVTDALVCPLRLPTGETLGAFFILFDHPNDVPSDLARLTADAAGTAVAMSYPLLDRLGK